MALPTLQAAVLRPGAITRMIVSSPGQPGSAQTISLTLMPMSGLRPSASNT